MAYWGKIRGHSKVHRYDKHHWRISQGYWCTRAKTGILEHILYGSRHRNYAGPHAPICTDVVTRQYAVGASKSLVVAHFETPRVPGKARLRTTTIRMPRRAYRDLNDKVIEGPDDTDPHKYWKAIRGRPEMYTTITRLVLETAYRAKTFPLAAINATVGKVNFRTISSLGANPEVLLFAGLKTDYKYTRTLVYVDYYFDFCPSWGQRSSSSSSTVYGIQTTRPPGWNDYVQSQPFAYAAASVPTYLAGDAAGSPTGPLYAVPVMRPDPNDKSEPRKMFATWDFSYLFRMVEW